MPCYSPLSAMRLADGSVVFNGKSGAGDSLELSCGQCVGCRLERSRQWAVRCLHEASFFDQNCFLTLTYDDDHLPVDRSLNYDHFQKFMKRLRKRFPATKIRFYMCGEYGENFGRPHYHACIFGLDFPDKVLFKNSVDSNKLYTSKILESLWPFGFASVGDVTFDSAAYVARYIMTKITGKAADSYYSRVDEETGEIYKIKPEFNKMSLKPGIGYRWFDKYTSDVFPHDYVVVNGKKATPPKYYFKKLESKYPELHEDIVFSRYVKSHTSEKLADNTSDRLSVKERVAKAGLSFFKRKLS